MLMRKINAVLSLLITFLMMGHAISYSVWMISRGTIGQNIAFMSWVLMGLMFFHVFICVDFIVTGIMESAEHKCKKYPQMNKSTLVQRISGALLIVFAPLHAAGAAGYIQPPKVVHAIIPPLFFAIALIHASVSVGKALITLGIGSAKFVEVADIAAKVICAATFIAAVTGFYMYKV